MISREPILRVARQLDTGDAGWGEERPVAELAHASAENGYRGSVHLIGVVLLVCWLQFLFLVSARIADAAEEPRKRTILLAQATSSDEAEEDLWGDVEEMVVLGAGGLSVGDYADADSVLAFDADDLVAVGAQDVSDLADFTPNLEIVNSGATTPTFFIRGVGLNDFNSNSTGAVAIYVDGIAINAPAMQLGTLFDIEGVTVLRGPQGVGLNRNASAGAIKVRSRRPTGEVGGYFRSDFGTYGLMDFEGAVEAPIVQDVLNARISFRTTQRDGFTKNRCAGAPPVGSRVPYPGASANNARGLGPWSICGEAQEFDSAGDLSLIPQGLERKVGNVENWATRGVFTLDPDIPNFPIVFAMSLHGSRRDELTRLGQSVGTGGFFCRDGDICSAPFFGIPPDERGTRTSGLYGGRQGRTGGDYQAPEIFRRLGQLSPCSVVDSAGNPSSVGSCISQGNDARVRENRARIALARELGRELDSEPYQGDYNFTGVTTNTVYGGFLESDLEMTDELRLVSNLAADAYNRSIENDADNSPETLFHIFTNDAGRQVYTDLELKGEFFDRDNPFSFGLGGWFLWEELDVEVVNDLGRDASVGVGAREYRQTAWSAGASFDASLDFFEDFTLDAGVRYNWDRKDLDYFLVPGSSQGSQDFEFTNLDETWQAATGLVRLTYRFREDIQVFAKYTRGWKPGTYNATSGEGREVTIADPEEIDAYEVGIEGSWFEDRASLRAQLFYYAYAEYQIFTTQQQLGGNTVFVTLNADDAEVYGAEMEAKFTPFEYTTFILNMSWLESQFLDFVQVNQEIATGGVFFQQVQNSGNQLLNSPRFKVVLGFSQDVPLGSLGDLSFRYDGVWSDDTFFDASEGLGAPNILGEQFFPDYAVGQKAYWLHNLRIGWRSLEGSLEAAFWIRNLTNEAYKTFAFDASSFQNSTVQFVGDPRTFGSSFSFHF